MRWLDRTTGRVLHRVSVPGQGEDGGPVVPTRAMRVRVSPLLWEVARQNC